VSKYQQVVPVPGPKLLEAIGEVTVKWAALESLLDSLLFWASDPADGTIADLLARKSIDVRWSRLKEIIVKDHTGHPGNTALLTVIGDALSVKGQRDTLVHGIFSDRNNNPSPDAVLATIMGKRGFQDWAVDRPRILETARKIDEIASRFMNLQIDYGERISDTTIRMNAWRHKDRLKD
jgi:hypothetical protein